MSSQFSFSPPSWTRIPVLDVNLIFNLNDGDEKLRVIIQQIINLSLTAPNEVVLGEEINSFITALNAWLENNNGVLFHQFILDYFKNTRYFGSFESNDGRITARQHPQDSSNDCTLLFRFGFRNRERWFPMLRVVGINQKDMDSILRQKDMSGARSEIGRLYEDYLRHQAHIRRSSLDLSHLEPQQKRMTLEEEEEEEEVENQGSSPQWEPAGDLQPGPLLSLEQLEDLRDTRFDDQEFQAFLTLAGYESATEFFEDIEELSYEVMRHDDQTYDDVPLSSLLAFAQADAAAIRLVLRFFASIQENGRLAYDSMSATEMSELLGYDVGSGALTFISLVTVYLIWRVLAKNNEYILVIPHDIFTVRFDFTSGDPGTNQFDITTSYYARFYPSWVENITVEEGRTLMIMRLRSMFGRVHYTIQQSFGEQKEYWYHGAGTDKNAELFKKLELTIQGIEIRKRVRPNTEEPHEKRRNAEKDLLDSDEIVGSGLVTPLFYPKYIIGNNAFWEWYFVADTQRSKFYEEDKEYITMMPDKNLQGEELSGCLIRALKCTCPKGTLYCRCHDDEQYPPVFIENVSELCKDMPALIIAINIYPKALRKTKDYRVVMCNPHYFESDDARVVIINLPNYRSANGHCCLFRPPDIGYLRDDWQRFVDRSFFNRFLHKCTRTVYNICPICGKDYPKEMMKAHYKYHKAGLSCIDCGINFNSAEELDVHREYHCRHIGLGSTFEFPKEIKGYVDKSNEKPRAVIYADLESAIEEDGTHKTILCGFCEATEQKVYIYETIWNLFTYAAKRPEEEILIYFHNGEGYDFHFVLLELGKMSTDYVKKITVTADSSEKIRYFEVEFKPPQYPVKKLKFRDSFSFVQQSLAKWVDSTKASGYSFPCFCANFRDERKRKLILQKNPFPYNAIKSSEDLKQDIEIMDYWFVQPNNTELFCDKYTSEELDNIYKTWYIPAKALFKWKTVDDYYRTYLKCDVSQLCDVMEHFANEVKNEFGELDIHNYYGTPSLTWAAWLRANTFSLEPVKESDFDIINGSIRGGQTGAMTRYYDCIARNEDQGSFCCDLDCNSLYATVMLEFEYPCYDWQTVTDYIPIPELELWLKRLHENKRSGFVECDIDVPDDPRIYSYVPIASRKLITGCYNYPAMREYAQGLNENPNHFIFSGLVNVVGKQLHYCCHTELLEFYLSHKFVEVTKIHKIIHAKTAPLFHDYVKHNLDQRTKYKSDPIKNLLYKLMNNSLYGKTYEDVTKRMEMDVVRKDKLDSVPEETIKRTILQLDKWVIIERFKREFIIDKPIYLGACITEFSKLWMYRFFYDDIRGKFPDAQVMYTDTDALTIKFPTGVTSFMELANKLNTPERQIIDTSNWHNVETLPLIHTAANNRPGLFKSETGDARILRMCALRAKTYIMVCDDGSVKMSVKGCPMKEKSKLTLLDFYNVLMGDGTPKMIEYDALVSKYHIVKSTQLTRVVLSGDDRKRYISDDRIHTYPLFSQPHKDALGK